MKRLILLLAVCACGGSSPKTKSGGGKLAMPDDAAVAAFRAEMSYLSEGFFNCHKRARAVNHKTQGNIEFEVARTGEQPLAVTVRQNGTGSNELAECSKSRILEHDFAGIVKANQVYRSQVSFPDRGPNYLVHESDVTPLAVSENFQVMTFLDPEVVASSDASLSIWRLNAGLPLEEQAADELWFVLGGEGKIYDDRGASKGSKIYPGSTVYVPKGAMRGYDHKSEEPLVAVVVYTPAGPEQRFGAPVPAEETPKKKKKGKSKKVVVKQIGKIKSMMIGGGAGEVRKIIGAGEKSEVYLGAITLFGKKEVPEHQHDDAVEVLYVIEGGGDMTLEVLKDSLTGNPVLSVGPGMAIFIPKGVPHSFKSTSDTATKAIQLYVPRGPEDRFKKGKAK